MTMTETRPEETSAGMPAPPPDVLAPTPGLAGWLSTTDHKRIGHLYVITALLSLVGVLVLVGVVNIERTASGAGTVVVSSAAIAQLSSLASLGVVFLAVVPLWLGLATYLVPLQVGAHSIAFPRAAAAGYWGYLLGAGLLLGSYAIDGGPAGARAEGVELFLIAMGVLVTSLLLSGICIGATVLTLRAPGMGIGQVPSFTWSALVGVVMLLVTLPVLLANLVLLYLDHRYGQVFLGGATGVFRYVEWVFLQPQVLVFALPALGFVADAVPVAAGRRQIERGLVLAAIGAFGVLGFGAFLQTGLMPGVRGEPLAIGMAVLAVIPVLVLLGLWSRTLAASASQVGITPPLLVALTTMALALLAVAAGAVTVIDPLELRGTTWDTGVFNAFVLGIGLLGAFGALLFWGPKMWGRRLSGGASVLVWLAASLGVLLLVVPDLVNGLLDQPAGAWEYDASSVAFLNGLTVAGAALLVVAVAVLLIDVFRVAADPSAPRAGSDPWGGFTLEWSTASPPPIDNFTGPLPEIRSDCPLLDAREREEAAR